jgi:hypothetical protein
LKNNITQKTLLKFIFSYGLIAAITIIFAYLLNIGIPSMGGDYGFGTKGFFKAGNDIGLTLLLCNCIACYLFFLDNKFTILIVIFTVGACLIGSIAGLLGSLLIIISMIICIILYKKKYKVKIYMLLALLLFIPIIISAFNYVSNYDDYMLRKMEEFRKGTRYSLVMSRYSLVLLGKDVLKESSDVELLFGRGCTIFSIQLQNKSIGVKFVEVDIYDLLGVYGVFLALMFFIYPFIILLKSVNIYFRRKNLLSYWIIIASMLFFGHSFFAGHAVTSIQSSTIYISFSSLILLLNRNAFQRNPKEIIIDK